MADSAPERYEAAKKKRAAFDDKYKGQALADLLQAMYKLRTQLDKLDEKKKPIQNEYDYLCMMRVPETADDEGVSAITLKFGKERKRLQLTGDIFLSTLDQSAAIEWLQDSGRESVVKTDPYFEASTVKGIIKAIMEKGEEELPEDVFKITPITRASLVKV